MVSTLPLDRPNPSPAGAPRPAPSPRSSHASHDRRAHRTRRARAALVFTALAAASFVGCTRAAPTPAPTPANAVPPPVAAPPAGTVVAPLAAPVPLVGTADVASLVERLKPTVVNITTTSSRGGDDDGNVFGGGSPFPMPFGGGGPRSTRALGTGFIVDPAGFVVTNAHVVQGADEIKVRLSDERTLPAKVIGRDAALDLALLQLDGASNLSAVALGDSEGLRVGDWVLAIGNPFGLGHTVTLGITSAKGRTIGASQYDDFIQTDASINPGNSGGPLFNLKGEVVGIPTAIRQGAQGIGFAVPVNALREVLPQLRERGSVSRGYLGVRYQPVTDELAQGLGLDRRRGALVSEVEAHTPGARAGLQPGDVITAVNGTDVARYEDLPRLIARNAPGAKVKLGVLRNGKNLDLATTLDPRPDRDDDENPSPNPSPATAPKGRLGVVLEDAPGGGALVRAIAPRSPAAGQIRPGDIILEADKKPIRSASELAKRVDALPSGQVLVLRVRQSRATTYVAIRLN
ncbi:MAG: Do family serine endopeptidase [Polyangiaceae bacterium]|nr:Do family serine endopeptidase [Polyangiaceae bacterium]